jgi:PAS domain S-box-containing protein
MLKAQPRALNFLSHCVIYRHSLRWRILFLLSFVWLIILALIWAGVTYFVSGTEHLAWQGRQAEASHNATETVATFLDNVHNTMNMVGLLDPTYLAANPQVTQGLLAQNPTLLELIRLDSSGVVIASTYQDAPILADLFTIPQSEWFHQAVTGQFYLGRVQISANNKPYLILAVPTVDGGVVAARLYMNVLWEVIGKIRFGQTGQAYIVDQDRRIVAHRNPAVVLANTTLNSQLELVSHLQTPLDEWKGEYVNLTGVTVVGVTTKVPGTGWTVITELPRSEAYATTLLAFLTLGSGLAVFWLLTTWIIDYVLNQIILKPVDKLRAGTRQIGAGDLDYQINLTGEDELGQLAVAFNLMTSRLRGRTNELAAQTADLAAEVNERVRAESALRQAHYELELRVKERTAELATANDRLHCELQERRRIEAALQQSEVKYRTLVEQVPAVTYTAGLNKINSTLYVSPQIKDLLGFSISEWQEDIDLWSKQIHPDDQDRVLAEVSAVRAANKPILLEYRLLTKAGRIVWVRDEDKIMYNEANQPAYLQGIMFDITTHKLAEEQIKTSLQEKEVLLKEIHHRVKNNLQVISSLLNLQSNYIQDPQTLKIFQDSQNRVRSMALIHEKLYRSENLAQIDFGDYIQELTAFLFRAQNAHEQGITLNLHTDRTLLNIEKAVPCGLIVNELISNTLKHAFPNGRGGQIRIEFHTNGHNQLNLVVADDGIGFPADLDFQATESLGMQLVNTLTDQLDGIISLERQPGTKFSIRFPAG